MKTIKYNLNISEHVAIDDIFRELERIPRIKAEIIQSSITVKTLVITIVDEEVDDEGVFALGMLIGQTITTRLMS